jgi:hypothetical protein
MKKAILFCGFVLVGSCLFGQNVFSNYHINNYGDNSFSNYSLTLSPLADNKATRAIDNRWSAFVLNLLLGFGIGSFVQGDALGGVIGLCGEIGGATLLVVGIIPKEEQVYHQGYQGNYGYYTTESSFNNIGLAYIGLGVLLGTRIFELVRPFSYANSFSVAFAPNFDVNGQPALTALMKLKM